MKRRFLSLAVFLLSACLVQPQSAIAQHPDDVWWETGPGVTTVDNRVSALTNYAGKLIVGGWLLAACDTRVNYVGAWDGVSWSDLGGGVDAIVDALTVYDSKLIVAGGFANAGGVPADGIAAWDGTAWASLGASFNGIKTMVEFGGDLIVGGSFTTGGGAPADYIASWDGSTWSSMGTAITNWVYSVAVHNGMLYAGGYAGGSEAVFVWNGSDWTPVSGAPAYVYTIMSFGGDLVAGGDFTTAGGVPCSNIARWDGSAWYALGDGLDNNVYTLTSYNGQLHAGGSFGNSGVVPMKGVVVWNGSNWAALGTEWMATTYALDVYGTDLVSGGDFLGIPQMHFADLGAWDGASWSPLGCAVDKKVTGDDVAIHDGKVIASTYQEKVGGVWSSYVAEWNGGDSFTKLGYALTTGTGQPAVVEDIVDFGSDMVAGGNFTAIGGIPMSGVARWDGAVWWSIGSGLPASVTAVAVYNSNLFAAVYTGPNFADLYKWDGSSWTLATQVGSASAPWPIVVNDMTTFAGELIMGGYLASPGGGSASVATWDGVTLNYYGLWYTYRVLEYGGRLIDAEEDGLYATFGPPIPEPLTPNPPTYAIASYQGGLVAFVDTPSPYGPGSLAFYDGTTWTYGLFGSGVVGNVLDMIEHNGELVVCGNITVAGNKVSSGIARYTKPSLTPVRDDGVPGRTTLSQNYPNPFNPSTTIQYQLESPGQISIDICAVSGQLVRHLDEGIKAPGAHTVEWNGLDANGGTVASGVYFYRLVVDGNVVGARRMLLLK